MRLIGKPRLFALAKDAAPALRGAVLALHAELVSADWTSVEEALRAFPTAERARHRLVITLDDRHCAVVGINYEVGTAVVEFAGLSVDRTDTHKKTGRRA